MENGISRRGFLRRLLGGAAVAAVAPTLLVPERKIWVVAINHRGPFKSAGPPPDIGPWPE